MFIIITIIIGIIIFYKMVIPYIHTQYQPTTEKRITKGLLSMSFWQILFGSLVCAYALEIEPVYKQTDEDVNSFLQESPEVSDLISEYTGINAYSNFNYLMSEAQSLHTHATVFIIGTIIIALIISIGAVSKRIDRRIVEGLVILNTLACCWIAKSSTDLYEMIIRDGVTLQTIAWIGRLLGTDIYAAMDMIIRSIWILPIILIIKHFFYHKTLNEYYRIDVHKKNDTGLVNKTSNTYPTEITTPPIINEDLVREESPSNIPNSQADKKVENVTDSKQSIEETKEEIAQPDVKPEKTEPNPSKAPLSYEYEDDESSQSKRWLIIGGVVLVGFIVYFYWPYNQDTNPTSSSQEQTHEESKSESESFEERSEAIIAQLTEEYGDKIKIIGKYPELSEYIAFVSGESRLILNNVEGKQQKEFDFPLRLGNSDRCGIPTQAFDSNDKSKILIIGENGGNEFADMAFLLEYDPSTDKIRELGWGLNLERQANRIKITRRWTTYWDEENYNHEYAFIDIYYDLNGNPIPFPFQGKNYHFKGKIDSQYPVMMSLSIKDDKICGAYYYEKKGSANKLYLYGGISESSDIVLLEFNSEAEQTGTFFGRIVDNTFSGTFTNDAGVEMPFELFLGNDASSNTTLKRYYNSRFDYSILYPSSFNIIKEPENGDGCRFSKDGNTYLSVSGIYNSLDETLEDVYKRYKSKSPAYCRIKDNWFVVSDNTDDGCIFYQKTVLKDGIFMTAILHYPSSENDYYSTLIPKIFTEFPD